MSTSLPKASLLMAIHALVCSELCFAKVSDASLDKLSALAEHFTEGFVPPEYEESQAITYILDQVKAEIKPEVTALPDHLAVLIVGALLINRLPGLTIPDKIALLSLSNTIKTHFTPSTITADGMVDHIHSLYIVD